ncbi:MAG: hypothetical protein ABSE17_02930 [Candidatus Levyibacteriota bacterium]
MGENTLGSPRPDALRRTRRELVEQIKQTPKSERGRIIEAGHARDELAEQFMTNQQEVRVDMGELGEQMARYIVLTPPEGRKTAETDSKPPIFLIPGISNDLESMGMLPQEIAFEGRKVVTIAYPESWHGNVTDAFGKAAEESPTFEPHASFFKQAIENIRQNLDVQAQLGDHQQIELWGFSAGALIVSEMLTDRNFSQEVSNAAIIAPASNFDQTMNAAKLNISKDQFITYGIDFKNTAKMNPNFRTEIEYTTDFRKRMQRTFDALSKKVTRRYSWWEQDMTVAEGGKIAVVSYWTDQQAQTKRVEVEIRRKPNLEPVMLSGTHETPKIESETLINAISKVFA